MITDPTTAEINLFNALGVLDKAYRNDGECIESGLQSFLRSYNVGGYTPQVAKILIEKNLVKNNPKGTTRNPLIYYNSSTSPNLELCREIFELIRSRKRISEAMKSQKGVIIVEKSSFGKATSFPDTKQEAINEMKEDVLKQLEYHSAEQLKYKNIYEYLNQKS